MRVRVVLKTYESGGEEVSWTLNSYDQAIWHRIAELLGSRLWEWGWSARRRERYDTISEDEALLINPAWKKQDRDL